MTSEGHRLTRGTKSILLNALLAQNFLSQKSKVDDKDDDEAGAGAGAPSRLLLRLHHW